MSGSSRIVLLARFGVTLRWVGLAVIGIAMGATACTESEVEPASEPLALEQRGEEGTLRFELRSSAPLVEGANDLEIVVRDGDTLLSNVKVVVRTSMPAMKHEPIEKEASLTDEGAYEADGLVFSMPGEWHVDVEAENDTVHDVAEFLVEIP